MRGVCLFPDEYENEICISKICTCAVYIRGISKQTHYYVRLEALFIHVSKNLNGLNYMSKIFIISKSINN